MGAPWEGSLGDDAWLQHKSCCVFQGFKTRRTLDLTWPNTSDTFTVEPSLLTLSKGYAATQVLRRRAVSWCDVSETLAQGSFRPGRYSNQMKFEAKCLYFPIISRPNLSLDFMIGAATRFNKAPRNSDGQLAIPAAIEKKLTERRRLSTDTVTAGVQTMAWTWSTTYYFVRKQLQDKKHQFSVLSIPRPGPHTDLMEAQMLSFGFE